MWATVSTRGPGRRSTPTGSHGSSRSLRPTPGQTLTASCCGRYPPRGLTEPTTGASRPSPRRRGEDGRTGPRRTVLPRVRAAGPSPRGSPGPPESLHELLLVHRTRGRPAPVPHHPVRRGHRGGRGNLRAHIGPDDPDVAAHPRVVHARSVQLRDTWPVLASTLGTGVPPTGLVRDACLPMGLTLPPDASESCRGE